MNADLAQDENDIVTKTRDPFVVGGDLDREFLYVAGDPNSLLAQRPGTYQMQAGENVTSDETAYFTASSVLFTDSAENAAERPVKNSKERAECGLLTALHNSVGVLRQLIQSKELNQNQTHP
jgi:hypothetical protein